MYSVIGEIIEVQDVINSLTAEKIYILTINVNDIILDVAINHLDLIGEAQIGRRFKGVIWLQGHINYPEE